MTLDLSYCQADNIGPPLSSRKRFEKLGTSSLLLAPLQMPFGPWSLPESGVIGNHILTAAIVSGHSIVVMVVWIRLRRRKAAAGKKAANDTTSDTTAAVLTVPIYQCGSGAESPGEEEEASRKGGQKEKNDNSSNNTTCPYTTGHSFTDACAKAKFPRFSLQCVYFLLPRDEHAHGAERSRQRRHVGQRQRRRGLSRRRTRNVVRDSAARNAADVRGAKCQRHVHLSLCAADAFGKDAGNVYAHVSAEVVVAALLPVGKWGPPWATRRLGVAVSPWNATWVRSFGLMPVTFVVINAVLVSVPSYSVPSCIACTSFSCFCFSSMEGCTSSPPNPRASDVVHSGGVRGRSRPARGGVTLGMAHPPHGTW